MPNFTKAHRVPQASVLGRVRRCPRGATTIEFALVLLAFLTLVLGMMDLAIGIFRSAVLAQTARTAVREAVVHGELAIAWDSTDPPVSSVWGPGSIPKTTVQDLAHDIKHTIASSLVGIDPSEVYVQVQWPDNSNAIGDRVYVRLDHAYTPVCGFIFGQIEIPLVGSSTMQITH